MQDVKDCPDETRTKYLGIALDKAERLEDLINEFFDITRFNLTGVTLDYQTLDLTRMLEQTAFEFEPMLQEKGLSCDLQMKEPVVLRCDPDKLQRVFDNILRNALAYSFPNSAITISIDETDIEKNSIRIHFTNHGNTINKEQIERIFEQFYRLDNARSSTGGSGFGLAIAKQIVMLHRGMIAAKSENDETTFTVMLPL